jgi:hypothetical protein
MTSTIKSITLNSDAYPADKDAMEDVRLKLLRYIKYHPPHESHILLLIFGPLFARRRVCEFRHRDLNATCCFVYVFHVDL